MKDLIMIGGGIAIGWYLALNKKKEVENALRIAKKEINNLFYTILKFKYKQDRGLWSWNEIEEMDIELDAIKETSTKYSFYYFFIAYFINTRVKVVEICV